jgi:uncharacterized SAM-binding protein YcdF (DUF218 family)
MERRRFVTTRLLVVLLAVLALAAGVIAFRGAGRWLVREDPLVAADAIVVLSGSMPQRAEGAADLYRAGYAPEVWVTRPDSPEAELSEMGIRFVGEEEYSRQVLIHQGVPASTIRILPDAVINTEQEIEEIAWEMRAANKSHVIIVTSAQHTRRVRTLWSRLAASNQIATVEAAAEDPFDRDHWWRNTRDAYAVVREMMGLMNAWAGLTVRPRSPRT